MDEHGGLHIVEPGSALLALSGVRAATSFRAGCRTGISSRVDLDCRAHCVLGSMQPAKYGHDHRWLFSDFLRAAAQVVATRKAQQMVSDLALPLGGMQEMSTGSHTSQVALRLALLSAFRARRWVSRRLLVLRLLPTSRHTALDYVAPSTMEDVSYTRADSTAVSGGVKKRKAPLAIPSLLAISSPHASALTSLIHLLLISVCAPRTRADDPFPDVLAG
ncbi:hypothetical protein B0H13DRAFT_2486832 [Mycena leptocephala]|nr:hypothetical protein B0H13DRAFT_2486832 [Mycena leptocephala]